MNRDDTDVYPASIQRRPSTRSFQSSILTSKDHKNSTLTEQFLESKKRNRDMHTHFKGKIPLSDLCLADFTCTLIKDNFPILGKLYLTCQNICFHSYIKDTREVIHVADVRELKLTGVMATGLRLELDGQQIEFIHFFFRQRAEKCIRGILGAYKEFQLGSRDLGSDLTGKSVPRSIQRKISRILEPHLESQEITSDAYINSRDYEETQRSWGKREIAFALVAFIVFAMNLHFAFMSYFINY